MLRLALSRAAVSTTRASLALKPVPALSARHLRPPAAVQFARFVSKDSEPAWIAPKMTYERVKRRSEQPSLDSYIIDVRERDEVVSGSIPSSVNLPLSDFSASIFSLYPEAFKEKYGFEKPKKDQEIVVYCRSGKRSATAADILKRAGYKTIYNYEGSWLDWSARQQVGGSS